MQLDRIVTLQTRRNSSVPSAALSARSYVVDGETSADALSGLNSGRVGFEGGLAACTAVFLSPVDADGERLPFPPSLAPGRLEVQDLMGNGGIFTVSGLTLPQSIDENRLPKAPTVWRLAVTAVQLLGSGVSGGDAVTVTGSATADAVSVNGWFQYRLWAYRQDRSGNQLRDRDLPVQEIAVRQTVWTFRGDVGAVVPKVKDTFTDDEGVGWKVEGVADQGARNRLTDCFCEHVN